MKPCLCVAVAVMGGSVKCKHDGFVRGCVCVFDSVHPLISATVRTPERRVHIPCIYDQWSEQTWARSV